MKTLDLNNLEEGIPVITPVIGAYIAQAAAVALAVNGHSSGVTLKMTGFEKEEFQIVWEEKIEKNTLKSWADLKEAAEYGAVAIAILVLMEMGEYNYFERMHQGAGFDYWLDTYNGADWEENIQEKKARLEISGILKESKSNSIKMRLGIKTKQVKKGNFTMPALVAVVAFSEPKIEIIKLW